MDCTSKRIPYRETGSFSKIVLDYLDQQDSLKPFFAYPPSLTGIREALAARKQFPTDRKLLVQHLSNQYKAVPASDAVKKNIDLLLSPDTFTITTAHQPNIFTGPLYFLYKILHAIKLAEHLTGVMPGHHFVPVYYMGSEDADLDELGHIYLEGEKLEWKTQQTGAVGRMVIDQSFQALITRMEGQLSVLPYGRDLIQLLKEHYREADTIEQATFKMVNALFGEYGLLVLLPDNAALKKQMTAVFQDDLLYQQPSAIVQKTSEQFGRLYKVQAHPREINLFYLEGDIRQRIEFVNGRYEVLHTKLSFSKDELLAELDAHPERFSPNVILRGLFQEMILPNIVFIGGGGELAYWLELKDLFTHYNVPYPVLALRNSFLLLEKKWQEKIAKLGLESTDFFLPTEQLVNKLVTRDSKNQVTLNGNLTGAAQLYDLLKKRAVAIDNTLGQHVEALKTRTLHQLQELEKKMLRAEKRKFVDQRRQVQSVKERIFPGDGLQERIDNFSYYYAKWGRDFIHQLYEHSPALEQAFVILSEK
jgi:bacillithiol biosynthesis cysteine-adding enzyme BshC